MKASKYENLENENIESEFFFEFQYFMFRRFNFDIFTSNLHFQLVDVDSVCCEFGESWSHNLDSLETRRINVIYKANKDFSRYIRRRDIFHLFWSVFNNLFVNFVFSTFRLDITENKSWKKQAHERKL